MVKKADIGTTFEKFTRGFFVGNGNEELREDSSK